MDSFNLFDKANNIIDESVLKVSAEASYQLFQALCKAGFTEPQAICLIGYIMTHPIQNGGNEE